VFSFAHDRASVLKTADRAMTIKLPSRIVQNHYNNSTDLEGE
jgi:hypothetical protein